MTLRTECDYCHEAKRVSELNARGDKMICDDCACDLQQLYRPRARRKRKRVGLGADLSDLRIEAIATKENEMTEAQIIRAGMMMKVLKLANVPGMDEVAIKLNCGLTWHEEQHAKAWAKAFEISQTEGNLFEQAYKLSEAMK